MSITEKLTEIEKRILEAIREVKYGTVEIIVHEGKVVQIEKSEKLRFNKNQQGD